MFSIALKYRCVRPDTLIDSKLYMLVYSLHAHQTSLLTNCITAIILQLHTYRCTVVH